MTRQRITTHDLHLETGMHHIIDLVETAVLALWTDDPARYQMIRRLLTEAAHQTATTIEENTIRTVTLDLVKNSSYPR